MHHQIESKTEVVDYINGLKGYRGYVQFSHREIDLEKDLFKTKDPEVSNEIGFVYEAHFFNGERAVAIRQLHDKWYADITENVCLDDANVFQSIAGNVYMAQIWRDEVDTLLCEGMTVKRLHKVVFAGFVEKGEEK